jgi:hypothetical protein
MGGFAGVLRVVLGKRGAWRWFFGGEVVVDCVVNVASLMVVFPR